MNYEESTWKITRRIVYNRYLHTPEEYLFKKYSEWKFACLTKLKPNSKIKWL